MRILDSYRNIKWRSSGVAFLDKGMVMSAKSRLSVDTSVFNGVSVKIIGKKISGNGLLNLYFKKKNGEILYCKDIKFTKSSWSEYSFKFNEKVVDGIFEISRSNKSFGRVEIGSVIIEDNRPIIIPEKDEESYLENTGYLNFYLKNIALNKKIVVIIPYGIYGGAEVYIKSIFSRVKNILNIEFLYLSENRLSFEMPNLNIKHRNVRTLERLSAVLINHKYDTIIFYNSKKVYNLISKIKQEKKINSKIIEIYHSDFIWKDAVARSRERSGVDYIFKISQDLASDISGVPDCDKMLMPVGIDTSIFIRKEDINLRGELGIPKGKTLFGLVARLSPEKNVEYALKLVKDMDDIHLAIIGSGPLSSNLKNFAEENNINNVSFLGYKKNVNDFYNIFDAFLLTSKMEGTPISILEAMSYCLPIYSTGVGQIANNFAHLDNFNILSGILETDREIIGSQINMPNYYQNLREYVIANHNIEKISNKFFEKVLNSSLSFREKSDTAEIIIGEYI